MSTLDEWCPDIYSILLSGTKKKSPIHMPSWVVVGGRLECILGNLHGVKYLYLLLCADPLSVLYIAVWLFLGWCLEYY